jgi:hypothetical protein
VAPLVAEGLGPEGEVEHLHELQQLPRRVRQVLAEALELIRLVAAAHAEHQAPVRHRVGHADLRDQPRRVVERHHHHAGA